MDVLFFTHGGQASGEVSGLLFLSHGKKVFLNLVIYIHINKGCNFNMTVMNSALTKKVSIEVNFFVTNIRFSSITSLNSFLFINVNFLQYKNPIITIFKQKIPDLTKSLY